jgi:hypothetical protein
MTADEAGGAGLRDAVHREDAARPSTRSSRQRVQPRRRERVRQDRHRSSPTRSATRRRPRRRAEEDRGAQQQRAGRERHVRVASAIKDRIANIEKQIKAEKLTGTGDGRGALQEAHHVRRQADHRDRDGRRGRGGSRQRRQEEGRPRRRRTRSEEGRAEEEGRLRLGSITGHQRQAQAAASTQQVASAGARGAAFPIATRRAAEQEPARREDHRRRARAVQERGSRALTAASPLLTHLTSDPGRRGARRDARDHEPDRQPARPAQAPALADPARRSTSPSTSRSRVRPSRPTHRRSSSPRSASSRSPPALINAWSSS